MTTWDEAHKDLLSQLPHKVREALRQGDDMGLAKALNELSEPEQEKVRDVIRKLSVLPEQMSSQPDENLGIASLDSINLDAELTREEGLPSVPNQRFRVAAGEEMRPPQDWMDTADRDDAEGSVLFPVWFATTRKRNQEGSWAKGFSGYRDAPGAVHYGVARVFVPASHVMGSLGSSWLKRWLWTWQDDRLALRKIEGRTEPEFWADLNQQLADLGPTLDGKPGPEKQILLFVHGFNVTFTAAVVRAAQLGYDLAFPGVTACFSWPSRGNVWNYATDEASCEPSVPALMEFLRNLVKLVGPGRVHVLSHSMGNRVVLRALQELAWEARAEPAAAPDRKIGNLLLAAPDIDRDLFRLMAPEFLQVSGRQTDLYVSRRDRAVFLSRWLHGYDRAGFHPPVTLVPGMTTIDVTKGDLSGDIVNKILGHSAYGDNGRVLMDMSQILHFDALAGDARRPLVRVGGGTHWELA